MGSRKNLPLHRVGSLNRGRVGRDRETSGKLGTFGREEENSVSKHRAQGLSSLCLISDTVQHRQLSSLFNFF